MKHWHPLSDTSHSDVPELSVTWVVPHGADPFLQAPLCFGTGGLLSVCNFNPRSQIHTMWQNAAPGKEALNFCRCAAWAVEHRSMWGDPFISLSRAIDGRVEKIAIQFASDMC